MTKQWKWLFLVEMDGLFALEPINWMKKMVNYSSEENLADSKIGKNVNCDE